jgi:tRNA(Ile2) C34 agmatinyltransferase TiaS
LKQELLFIGLDDTDTLESRGTGHLARQIAGALAADCPVLGVTRHQLLVDPRVPYTAKNSSAAIVLEPNGHFDTEALLTRVQAVMREHFNPGSDPGLCVASHIPEDITAFGRRVQREVVTQEEARALAAVHAIRLMGLGGSEDGVIGALAAVGLAASGDDGRYVLVGRSRELSGLQPVSAVLAAGVTEVRTLDHRPVTQGLILTDKLRPARREARPIAFVEWCEGYWRPLKLD